MPQKKLGNDLWRCKERQEDTLIESIDISRVKDQVTDFDLSLLTRVVWRQPAVALRLGEMAGWINA